MYEYNERPATKIVESSRAILRDLVKRDYAVLVGRNNSGKSYLLKTLRHEAGPSAIYLGPARYHNFSVLGVYARNRSRLTERWTQFVNHWQNAQQNIDNSPLNLQQAIAALTDDRREVLFEIIKLLLGTDLKVQRVDNSNSLSQRYIACDQHNISYASSGVRLVTTLITSLLDTDADTFFIDEPELGISPEAQGILADFLFSREDREKYFPHVRTLVIATHSTIFLDRKCIHNNYMVTKSGDEIEVARVDNYADFNRIHFLLLGNRFETLFLPSAIILVEGKCDKAFVERVLAVRYPEHLVSVVAAHSDSKIKEILNMAKGILADLQRSPYRDRIFVILDATHTPGLKPQLEKMGLPGEQVIVWPRNGIEYYYPPSLISKIYGGPVDLQIEGDRVLGNGAAYTKAELSAMIVAQTDGLTEMHSDFRDLFLKRLEERLQK